MLKSKENQKNYCFFTLLLLNLQHETSLKYLIHKYHKPLMKNQRSLFALFRRCHPTYHSIGHFQAHISL